MAKAKRNYWRLPVIALNDVLSKDIDLKTRPINSNTNKPQTVSTKFDVFFSWEEYFLKLESQNDKQPIQKLLETPLILSYYRKSIEIERENSKQLFTPNLKIDVITSNPELDVAKEEGCDLCLDIDATIELNKNLNFNVSICRVIRIEEVGFLKEINYPYFFIHTLHLKTQFSN